MIKLIKVSKLMIFKKFLLSMLIFTFGFSAAADEHDPVAEAEETARAAADAQAGVSRNANNTSAPQVSAAIDYDKIHRSCIDKEQDARRICNENENEPLTILQQTIPKIAGAVGGAMICNRFGQIMFAGSIALSSFRTNCQKSSAVCEKTCEAAEDSFLEKQHLCKLSQSVTDPACTMMPEYLRLAGKNRSECRGNNRKVTNAAQLVSQGVVAFMAMQQCKQQSLALAGDLCKREPSSPFCAQLNVNVDCSLAANATNLVCKCKANPNSPDCMGGGEIGRTPATVQRVGSGAGGGGTGEGLDSFDAGGLLDGIGDNPLVQPGKGERSAQSPDGGGGAGGGGGFGNVNPNNGDGGGGGGGGAPGQDANVLRGFHGGGAGAAVGGGPRGSGGSGSSSSSGRGAGGGAGFDPNMLKESLAKRRFPSGIIHPDGICGRHCNIFDSVNSRYLNLKPSLLEK